ncbi:MAG: GNAT family N-acetyltransferase [Promethearchaeia archaeon]
MNRRINDFTIGRANKIEFKQATPNNLYDIRLCGKEFLDFIKDFKEKFLDGKISVLTAHYKNTLVGILVTEDKSSKVNSIERILPMMCIHLIYVNKSFRNQGIATSLLEYFVKNQKEVGTASVFAKIPKKYRKGIEFFLKNDFYIIKRKRNKIILKRKLWNDFGLKKCLLIGDSLNDIFI